MASSRRQEPTPLERRGTAVPDARARSASPPLRIVALGQLRISRGATQVPPAAWVRLKSRTLFAYLLCARPRAVHRETLTDLLWPNIEPAHGAHALQVTLSDLRATLGGRKSCASGRPYVRRTGEHYALDVGESGWIDAEVFAVDCERGRQAEEAGDREAAARHLLAAEVRYTGDFLADEPHAGWAVARRERLRDDYVDVLLRLLRLHEAAGTIETAARYARKVLAVDPYLEPCYRALMRHMKALGDQGGVVRTYVRCQQAMHDGFDSEVSSETRALARALIGPRVDAVVRRHALARAVPTMMSGLAAETARGRE